MARFASLLPRPGNDPFAPLPAEHPFRIMAAAPGALATALIPHEVGPLAEARAFALARQGQHTMEGGLAGLHELLLGRVETFGGDQRERLTPIAVVTRRGRAVGIRVHPRDETIGCHHLIWAGAPASLDLAMGAAAPPARPLRVAGYRYAVALLAPPGGRPGGDAGTPFAVADPSRPLLEDNALAITVGPTGRANRRPRPRSGSSARCRPAPSRGARATSAPCVDGCIHTVTRLMPTLAGKPLLVASPHDGLPPEVPGSPAGKPQAGPPALPPPVFAPAAPRALDVIALPHASGLKRLYLAGRQPARASGWRGSWSRAGGWRTSSAAARPGATRASGAG